MTNKAGIVRIESDDLKSQPDGWVEIDAYVKARHYPYIVRVEPEVLTRPESYKTAKKLADAQQTFFDLACMFTHDWNWKAPDGTPYPKPYGKSDVIANLRRDELDWLIGHIYKVIGDDLAVAGGEGDELALPKKNDGGS